MANSQFAMAVHVMAMLAKNCDARITSDYLAKSVNTNAVVIRRLLRDLHEGDLVVSQTGYSGGTCLTRGADKIKLVEIYEAVSHDEVFGLHKNVPDKDCEIGSQITEVLCGLQEEISEAVRGKFANYVLQDMIDKIDKTANKNI